jgi:hypothetical protein
LGELSPGAASGKEHGEADGHRERDSGAQELHGHILNVKVSKKFQL